jgi:hypothetical protein
MVFRELPESCQCQSSVVSKTPGQRGSADLRGGANEWSSWLVRLIFLQPRLSPVINGCPQIQGDLNVTTTLYRFVMKTADLPPLQGESLFGMLPGLKPWAEGYSPFGALQFAHLGDHGWGPRRVFGPTGHRNLVQGLPCETRSNASSPEGAKVLWGRSNMRSACPDDPTGRPPIGKFTQGEPWAKLSCPFGAWTFGNYRTFKHLSQLSSRLLVLAPLNAPLGKAARW